MKHEGHITVYRYNELGHVDHGWLDARYHFNFASYYNPDRKGFGRLRVINDDVVKSGVGFDAHPHKDMEIITYVRQGAITHKDNMGNTGRTAAGDVQVMTAGSGVEHAEHNLEKEETRLYQIWIRPNKLGVKPSWEAKKFPQSSLSDKLALLVSGQAEHEGMGALYINQDAAIYGGKILKGSVISQKIKHQCYVLASDGSLEINGSQLDKGDGAEIVGMKEFLITAITDAEVIVIDVPE